MTLSRFQPDVDSDAKHGKEAISAAGTAADPTGSAAEFGRARQIVALMTRLTAT
jgi:hypothetical protein